jgi:carboxyl-terminal processing protease
MKGRLLIIFLLFFSFLNAKEDSATRLYSYTKFMKVVSIIEKYYVEPLSLDTIIEKLLKGGVSALDPHSSFEDKKAYKSLQDQTNGEFGGLGIVVSMKKGVLTVISPIDDTPAYRAGIKAGDIIVKINDKSTLDMTLDEDVKLMRGKPGTKITLLIVRNGKKIKVNLIRAIIKIKSVKEYAIKGYPDIEYIRISSFDKNVVSSLKTILAKMRNKKGIIIDLRNNPGGLLNQALGTLDLFIEDGKLLSEKGRNKNEDRTWYAHSAGTYNHIPIIILVNGGSASASEIVSGGMQDGKEHIQVNSYVGKSEKDKRALELLKAVRISNPEKRLNSYPHELSGGMRQRIGIAMALANDPDIIIADEPTTALDVTVQAQILKLFQDLRREKGLALVFITHDFGVISQICDKVAVMYAGKVVEIGPTAKILDSPAHPYTARLKSCVPELGQGKRNLLAIPGFPPMIDNMPPGCAFASRCQKVKQNCHLTAVDFTNIGQERGVRCLFPEEIKAG